MPDQLPLGLEELKIDYPDPSDPAINSRANQNGLTAWQRFVVKNIFDTQPKKRAQYLKEIGYELNPKNEEEYRPLNSTSKFVDLESKFNEPEREFFSLKTLTDPEAWKAFAKELAQDAGDILVDTVVEGPITSAGQLLGSNVGAAGAGAVTKNPVGIAAGAAGGGAVGAAGAKAFVEAIKAGVGELALDGDVPHDYQESVYQSIMTGALATVGKLGTDAFRKWAKIDATKAQKMLKQIAVRKSNGTWNDKLATDLAQHPEKYTPEAVEGATAKLVEFADKIFGTSAKNPYSTRQLKGGIARKAIDPLNERADLEIAKLSQMPEANFSVDEIVNSMRKRVEHLQGKVFLDQDEEAALNFISKEIEGLKMKARQPGLQLGPNGEGVPAMPGDAVRYRELSFKEGRDFLKRLQNAAFQAGPVKDNSTMKALANGLKDFADAKAAAVGSDLPAINARRSDILALYRDMERTFTDQALQAAYTGKDRLAKQRVQRMFSRADELLDTNLADEARDLQYASAVEALYNAPSAFGSGSTFMDMLNQGSKRASTTAFRYGSVVSGATAPLPVDFVTKAKLTGAAAGVGAVKGFIEGAKEGASFASPENLVRDFSKIKARIDVLEANPSIAREIFLGKAGTYNMGGAFNPGIVAGANLSPAQPPDQPAPPLQAAINPEPGAGPTSGAGVDAAANPAPMALPKGLEDLKIEYPEEP